MSKFKISLVILGSFIFSNFAFSQTVATVGSKKITLKEFQEKYDEVKKSTINPPEPSIFLEDLVRFEIGVQIAQQKKLEKDPIVKERFKQEMYKRLLEKEIGKQIEKIKISEKEMRQFYRKNPEVRLSHILIEYKPGANNKEKALAKKRAQEILAEVKKSKRPFSDLVKLYTDDTLSKNTGGDIQFQSRVTIVPPIYETALKMKVGQIRGPIQTQYGYHIIKLTGKRGYSQANKQQIRAAVFDTKRRQIFDKYFAKVSRQFQVKKNTKALKNVK